MPARFDPFLSHPVAEISTFANPVFDLPCRLRLLLDLSLTRHHHFCQLWLNSGKSEDELMEDVDAFVEKNDLHDIHDLLKKAALVAQDKSNFDRLPQLNEEERRFLREEKTHKWRQTKTLYCELCSFWADSLTRLPY